jgi:hypothetical protein
MLDGGAAPVFNLRSCPKMSVDHSRARVRPEAELFTLRGADGLDRGTSAEFVL